MQLVLGTRNHKKAAELTDLLAPHGFEVITLADVPQAIDIDETGQTFAANAALKARDLARHLRRWVLGEDSGLTVDALAGGPGVLSARFAGPDATDEANNSLLVQKLGDTPLERRGAHYVCHVTLADPTGAIRAETEGYCHGRIRFQPSGSQL
jgi:XTP/dITP diphosphohydrolase